MAVLLAVIFQIPRLNKMCDDRLREVGWGRDSQQRPSMVRWPVRVLMLPSLRPASEPPVTGTSGVLLVVFCIAEVKWLGATSVVGLHKR